MKTHFLYSGILLFFNFSYAKDLGFRYSNGACINERNEVGFNPSFIGPCGDLRGVTFNRISFDDLDLRGVQFANANLVSTTFNGSNLEGSSFNEAILLGSTFTNSIVKNATFINSDLKKSNFFDTTFDGCDFSFADLSNSNFSETRFTNSILSEAKLVTANLDATSFQFSKLQNSNFQKATFSEVMLADSQIDGAQFAEAQLLKTIFSRVQGNNIVFHSATGRKFSILESTVLQSKFGKAYFIDLNFSNSNFTGSDWKNATFSEGLFESTNLKDVTFNSRTLFAFNREQAVARGMIYLSYEKFEGVLNDLDFKDLSGWNICHESPANSIVDLSTVFTACDSSQLMIACRQNNVETLSVAAYGPKDLLLMEIGRSNEGSVVNGVKFYFSNNFSLGFAPATESLDRRSCDLGSTNPKQRLCFHTKANKLIDGFRCGESRQSRDFSRVFLKNDPD